MGDFNFIFSMTIESTLSLLVICSSRPVNQGLEWFVNTAIRVIDTTPTAHNKVITNIPRVLVSEINTPVSDHYGLEAVIENCNLRKESASQIKIEIHEKQTSTF